MELFQSLGYLGLFIYAFLVGFVTPLPPSEMLVSTFMVSTSMNVWGLFFVAVTGQWLGQMGCYLLGRLGKLEWIERWGKIPPDTLKKWERRIQKYGCLVCLISWVPFLSNISIICAGYFRCNPHVCATLLLIVMSIRMGLAVFATGLFI